MEIKKVLYTRDQNLRFLVDDALFSDSSAARIRAINQIAKDYGIMAIPVIQDIINTLSPTDEVFSAFCINILHKIKDEERGGSESNARQ